MKRYLVFLVILLTATFGNFSCKEDNSAVTRPSQSVAGLWSFVMTGEATGQGTLAIDVFGSGSGQVAFTYTDKTGTHALSVTLDLVYCNSREIEGMLLKPRGNNTYTGLGNWKGQFSDRFYASGTWDCIPSGWSNDQRYQGTFTMNKISGG